MLNKIKCEKHFQCEITVINRDFGTLTGVQCLWNTQRLWVVSECLIIKGTIENNLCPAIYGTMETVCVFTVCVCVGVLYLNALGGFIKHLKCVWLSGVPKHDPISTCKSHYWVNGSTALHSISATASIMYQFSHCMTQTLLHLLKVEKKLLAERNGDDYWFSLPDEKSDDPKHTWFSSGLLPWEEKERWAG